jgi:hypothetical protein
MKVLQHVVRNINEFNIPAGDPNAYEILYFGINLILMFDYRLSFDIEVKNSNSEIEALIISRKQVPAWKSDANTEEYGKPYYSKRGVRVSDVFKPSISDAYVFILRNRCPCTEDCFKTKKVEVTLVHTWHQEIKESQLSHRQQN